jgi:hypothetical protein
VQVARHLASWSYAIFSQRVTAASMSSRRNGDAVRDAVLFREPARVDEPAGGLTIAERKSEIDPGVSCRFDFGEDVPPIERHNRLTRTGFRVLASREPHLEELVVQGSERRALSREHGLDVPLGRLQIEVSGEVLAPLAQRELGDPRRVVRG